MAVGAAASVSGREDAVDADGLGAVLDRLVDLAMLGVLEPPVVVGLRVIGIQPDRLAVAGHRFFPVFTACETNTPVEFDSRELAWRGLGRRTGNGILHELIYEDTSEQDLIVEVLEAGARLNSILTKIDDGEGSLGMLLNDPTLYEDLKILVGGAQRSAIVRSLIRFAVGSGNEN